MRKDQTMAFTQEDLVRAGYNVPAAPVDDWRVYDAQNPVPNYFDFDWFSSRHPDLYHAFSLTTAGLMDELEKLVDLSGLAVIDVCAGTGRSAMGLARRAKTVTAVDIFPSVIAYGRERVREAGFRNITYVRGDSFTLPFANGSFDALTCSWGMWSYPEAYRVLRPGGYLIALGAPLEALCGELTATLAEQFPHIINDVAPAYVFDPDCPVEDTSFQEETWQGIPVMPPVFRHDFTYLADFGDPREAAAIYGRLYGPKARRYLEERQLQRVASRLRIEILRVQK